jgi:outer membrane protein
MTLSRPERTGLSREPVTASNKGEVFYGESSAPYRSRATLEKQNDPRVTAIPVNGVDCRHMALAAGMILLVCSLPSFGQSSAPSTQPLGLFDVLQATLANQPALHIQEQQVISSRAARREASGVFDTVIASTLSQNRVNTPLTLFDQEQASLLGIITNSQVSNLTTLDVGATKEYRNGVTVSPSLLTTRTTDNIYDIGGVNLTTLVFQVTVPLLRGRGRDVVAATETAAGIEVDASLLDLNQTISSLLSNSASSYWNAVAAARNLKVAQESEERGRIYVENIQTLIDAGRVPESELHQVNANLATRSAARIAAEQNLIAARQQLALAMGVSADQMESVGAPAEDFPIDDAKVLAVLNSHSPQQFFDLALEGRADYLAAGKREMEQRALLTPARNGVLPQLNLNLSSGYSSLDEGTGVGNFFSAPGKAPRGPDVGVGVTYQFPPSNDTAYGALMLAQSNVRQAELRTLQLSQSIMASVVTAVAGVRNAALQLQSAREAVTASQAALEGERDKYQLGVGQLVDVLTMEDRLTVAEQTQVNAELGYALALTQLRFATGSIVAPDQTVQSVSRDVFSTVPVPASQKPPDGKE